MVTKRLTLGSAYQRYENIHEIQAPNKLSVLVHIVDIANPAPTRASEIVFHLELGSGSFPHSTLGMLHFMLPIT